MNWKKVVSGVAPAIGTALLGPGGGAALAVLGKVLLGDEKASEENIAAAIASTPPGELTLKLQEENNRFTLASQLNAIEQSRVSLDNTSSAREMYSVKGGPQANLSYIMVVGFFVVTVVTFFLFASFGKAIPQEAVFLLGTLIGGLGNYVMTVMKFWFGGKPDDSQTMDFIYHATPPGDRKNG